MPETEAASRSLNPTTDHVKWVIVKARPPATNPMTHLFPDAPAVHDFAEKYATLKYTVDAFGASDISWSEADD